MKREKLAYNNNKLIVGVGYHMTMVKEPHCNVERLIKTVRSYVPEAKVESNISAELSIVLPNESSHQFEALFLNLEKKSIRLGHSEFWGFSHNNGGSFYQVGAQK